MQSEHGEADLNDYFENDVLLDRSVSAAFTPQIPLQVSILAVLHHDVDFGTRDEGVVVLHRVRMVLKLPMHVDLVQCLQRLALRHDVSLKLLND